MIFASDTAGQVGNPRKPRVAGLHLVVTLRRSGRAFAFSGQHFVGKLFDARTPPRVLIGAPQKLPFTEWPSRGATGWRPLLAHGGSFADAFAKTHKRVVSVELSLRAR